ncbi:hypothetical protein [Oceanobacillus rekensis]|uniref:hypothetical protein n=1 Tax=Oceanobacillus rekensis TaxID=937927 RepID=UPI000B43ED7E|nr:hypothetical protein [Oceanobacillus rekensis]
MNTLKRFLLYIFIILLFISIYQDIFMKPNSTPVKNDIEKLMINESYSIAHVKVLPGDTVLSVIETLNQDYLGRMDLQSLLNHFEQLNPTTDPHKIEPYKIYYFPVYREQ